MLFRIEPESNDRRSFFSEFGEKRKAFLEKKRDSTLRRPSHMRFLESTWNPGSFQVFSKKILKNAPQMRLGTILLRR